MKTSRLQILAGLVVAAVVVIAIVENRPSAVRTAAVQHAKSSTATSSSSSTAREKLPIPEQIQTDSSNTVASVAASGQVTQDATSLSPDASDESITDPAIARAALSLVGVDPYAEQYWIASIFDENLSDQERVDLMEDLNEDGLSDPQHPGPEDLPLIMNRLQIIEDVAPYADEFMLEHLMEAYKDLLNMLAGEPVQ